MTRAQLLAVISTLGAAVSLSALAWLAPGCDLNPQPQPPEFGSVSDNNGGHGSSGGAGSYGDGGAVTLNPQPYPPPLNLGDAAATDASGPLANSEGGAGADASGDAGISGLDASADSSPDAEDAQSDAHAVDTACDVAPEAGE